MSITHDDLMAKLYEVNPHERRRAQWVMNKDHFRDLWVMAWPDIDPDGYDVDEDRTRIEKALSEDAWLYGRPIVVEPDATEIEVRVQ